VSGQRTLFPAGLVKGFRKIGLGVPDESRPSDLSLANYSSKLRQSRRSPVPPTWHAACGHYSAPGRRKYDVAMIESPDRRALASTVTRSRRRALATRAIPAWGGIPAERTGGADPCVAAITCALGGGVGGSRPVG